LQTLLSTIFAKNFEKISGAKSARETQRFFKVFQGSFAAATKNPEQGVCGMNLASPQNQVCDFELFIKSFRQF